MISDALAAAAMLALMIAAPYALLALEAVR